MTKPDRLAAASATLAQPPRFPAAANPSAAPPRRAPITTAWRMPSARWRWMRSSRPSPAIPACRWARPMSRPCCSRQFLKFDPADPAWPDRDRFVLSAGHGSMLLYALFYLARLREDDDRRDQALPPARLAHARPSRARPHARRRNHHRPARPGARQCGRHGDRRAPPRRDLRRRYRRSHHLCARLRRRPDGRHQPGSDRARRPSAAQQAHRALRRQRHFDRRADLAVGFRRSGGALPARPAGRRRASTATIPRRSPPPSRRRRNPTGRR